MIQISIKKRVICGMILLLIPIILCGGCSPDSMPAGVVQPDRTGEETVTPAVATTDTDMPKLPTPTSTVTQVTTQTSAPIPTTTPTPTTITTPATKSTPKPTATPTPKSTTKSTPKPTFNGKALSNFPIIFQNPELPTGCEIVALTMMLRYYGYDVDKMTMANTYLPKARTSLHRGADGRMYGPDLYNYFAGDPTDVGITCGAGAIETAANAYLDSVNSTLRAKDITGTPVSELYEYVGNDIPVFVCVTIRMKNRGDIMGSWYTEDGRLMEWTNEDHGAVLIGYSETQVIMGDSISGRIVYDRLQFEKVYAQRGCQAVVLEEVLEGVP